jgi:hypothetical protein
MANGKTRISREVNSFADYMDITDDRQLEVNPITTNPRWQDWGWTLTESGQWTIFRTKCDALYNVYKQDAFRNDDVRNNLKQLIKDVVAYDKEHKLLDKISITPVPPAEIADFEKFNVKRGTPLADTTPTQSDVELGQPDIDIRTVKHLEHFLDVMPEDIGNPVVAGNIKNIEVWRAVVAAGTPEASPDQFTYVGDAKRRIFKSTFTDDQKRKDAHYKARIKGKNGKYYGFSKVVVETII